MSVPLSDTRLAEIRERVGLYLEIGPFDMARHMADLLAEIDRLRAQRAALVELHDWDMLIFGGFYCMHCSPEDSLDEPVAWPCPSLRAVGMTDEEGTAIIAAHRAAIAKTTAKES